MCEKPQVTKHTQEENVLLAETRNLEMFSPACRTAFSYIYLNILWKKKKSHLSIKYKQTKRNAWNGL